MVHRSEAALALSGLRIGFVVYGDPEQQTGGYIYDRRLARELSALGARVEFLALREPDGSGQGLEPEVLAARVVGSDLDFLLEDELCHEALPGVRASLPSDGRPLRVAVVHNLGFQARAGAERERFRDSELGYLCQVQAFVANSQHTKGQVDALVATELPSVVAYPGLGFEGSPPTKTATSSYADGLPGRPLRLLSVANLSPVKRTEHLLQALAELTSHPWTLDLVGSTERDPGYAAQIREQIERLGLAERVTMVGVLEGTALSDAYATADLMVLASREEGFGMACLEAMSWGTPVIASSRGAAPEFIRSNREGLLFDPDRSGSLTESLRQLFEAPDRLATMAGHAQARAARHPDWPESAARVARLLRELHDERAGT